MTLDHWFVRRCGGDRAPPVGDVPLKDWKVTPNGGDCKGMLPKMALNQVEDL